VAWIKVAKDKVQRRAFVNTVMSFRIPQKQDICLGSSRETLYHEVGYTKVRTKLRFSERQIKSHPFMENADLDSTPLIISFKYDLLCARYVVLRRMHSPQFIASKGKGQGKVVPVLLTEHHAMKAYWGEWR
jgi:hypothetical protein